MSQFIIRHNNTGKTFFELLGWDPLLATRYSKARAEQRIDELGLGLVCTPETVFEHEQNCLSTTHP